MNTLLSRLHPDRWLTGLWRNPDFVKLWGSLTITHFGGQGGSGHQPYRGIYHWHRSYLVYYRRHLARDYFFLVNWLMYAGMALKLGLALAANLLRREKVVGTRKP